MAATLTDDSLMPSGEYKDWKMADVPASHLLWLYENNRARADVREYIIDNLDIIKLQIKQHGRK